jgi:hypothetical protein
MTQIPDIRKLVNISNGTRKVTQTLMKDLIKPPPKAVDNPQPWAGKGESTSGMGKPKNIAVGMHQLARIGFANQIIAKAIYQDTDEVDARLEKEAKKTIFQWSKKEILAVKTLLSDMKSGNPGDAKKLMDLIKSSPQLFPAFNSRVSGDEVLEEDLIHMLNVLTPDENEIDVDQELHDLNRDLSRKRHELTKLREHDPDSDEAHVLDAEVAFLQELEKQATRKLRNERKEFNAPIKARIQKNQEKIKKLQTRIDNVNKYVGTPPPSTLKKYHDEIEVLTRTINLDLKSLAKEPALSKLDQDAATAEPEVEEMGYVWPPEEPEDEAAPAPKTPEHKGTSAPPKTVIRQESKRGEEAEDDNDEFTVDLGVPAAAHAVQVPLSSGNQKKLDTFQKQQLSTLLIKYFSPTSKFSTPKKQSSSEKDRVTKRLEEVLKEVPYDAYQHYHKKRTPTQVKGKFNDYLLSLVDEAGTHYDPAKSPLHYMEAVGSGLPTVRDDKREQKFMLGGLLVNVPKLAQNILSLSYLNKAKLKDFPNLKITDNYKNALVNIMKGIKPVLRNLTEGETKHLQKLVKTSGIMNEVKKGGCADMKADLLTRFDLVVGEIGAGNDNPELKVELSGMLTRLLKQKLITKEQALNFTNEYIL